MSACPVCQANQASLGRPSEARWLGPDGEGYCSMHFVARFGHAEPLVKIEGYEPPKKAKAPAKRRTRKKKEEVTDG
jgi:hypothetical protein